MEHNETLTKASYSRIEKKHSSYYHWGAVELRRVRVIEWCGVAIELLLSWVDIAIESMLLSWEEFGKEHIMTYNMDKQDNTIHVAT